MDELLNQKLNEMICRSENTDVLFDRLKNAVNQLKADNKSLHIRLQEYNKDEEIQKLEQEIRNLCNRSLLFFSEKEYQEWRKFLEHHSSHCGTQGHCIYDLCGTGIGTVIKLKCPICGEEVDITDYDCW